jgi:N-acetylglucosaminyldiphosphoundecaprenol N-acetyl-beta-D-mannosaminyltransferase
MNQHARIEVFDISTTAQPFQSAIDTILSYLADGQSHYVSTCTVATLMQAKDNPDIREALDEADMVCADGMPIVWMQKRLGHSQAERVYGPDVLLALCKATEHTDITHYFYGGLGDVPQLMVNALLENFPNLSIIGADAPPFIQIEDEPQLATIDKLNTINADIIWVGLGSPKQDLWMARYHQNLNARLLIGVGAAFDFMAGIKPQAPLWMQRRGLEWLYRLLTEPRRLWRRYFIYNSRFIWNVLRHM